MLIAGARCLTPKVTGGRGAAYRPADGLALALTNVRLAALASLRSDIVGVDVASEHFNKYIRRVFVIFLYCLPEWWNALCQKQMKAFKSLVLIFVGIAWALFWLVILTLITNDPSYSSNSEVRLLQTLCVLAMLMGVVSFGFGVSRLVG